MYKQQLTNDQWKRIKNLLPGKKRDSGVTAKNNRKFVEAVLWIARTGAPWRYLPAEYGHWHRVLSSPVIKFTDVWRILSPAMTQNDLQGRAAATSSATGSHTAQISV